MSVMQLVCINECLLLTGQGGPNTDEPPRHGLATVLHVRFLCGEFALLRVCADIMYVPAYVCICLAYLRGGGVWGCLSTLPSLRCVVRGECRLLQNDLP